MTSLKQQLFSGVMYTAIAKYSGILISLVVAGILGRLLTPEQFGVVAAATIVVSFFAIFSNIGISSAIIQHKDLTREDLSSIFSVTIWMGVILSLGFFFFSGLIAEYYRMPELADICKILSVNLFFAAASMVPNSLFYRDKKFKLLAIRSFVIQVAGGVLSVVAALAGWGIYALLINPILSSILLFIISFKEYPLHFYCFPKLDAMCRIFHYSTYQFLFNLVNYFSNNFDKLFIGRYMGMVPLGYYEKSFRLMALPLQNLTHVIGPVMHPVLSDYQDDKSKLASSYERIVRFLAFLGFPLGAILYFAANEMTILVFGDQWGPSVPVFQILAITVGIQVVISTSGSIFQAANDTKSLFICGIFSATLNVLGVLVGIFVFDTLEAVAVCLCVTFSINFLQCYWQLYRVTLRQRMGAFYKQLISPIACAGVVVLLLWPLSGLLDGTDLFLSLMVKGGAFVVIVAAYIQGTKEYDLLGKIKPLLGKLKR